jgi:hypothetical protein
MESKGEKNVPYTRLISEIFHQGKLLQKLQHVGVASDEELGTCTGRVISVLTLGHMKIVEKKKVIITDQDLQTSLNLSQLMEDFPLISKEDPPYMLAQFISVHY